LYRAIALSGRDDTNGFLPGRSAQSNLIRAERLPATPPELREPSSQQIDSQVVRLQFQSDALVETTPRGSFQFELFAWDAAQNRFADDPLLDTVLPNAQPLPATGTPEKGTLFYSPPDANSRRGFVILVDVPTDTFLYRLRLTDPLQRSSETIISGKIVQNDAPDLSNEAARRNGRDLLISFESMTRVTRPPFGVYQLEIAFAPASGGGVVLLISRPLHLIPVGDLASLPASLATTILREAKRRTGASIRYGAVIKNFFPASPLPIPRHGRVRILLTTPDGTSARVQILI
jgi:hypothetical protein